MTNEELEEKVKETFESIIDSIEKLGKDEKLFSPLQILLICVFFNVLDVYGRTPIHVDEKDIKHKWIYLAYKISQIVPQNLPLLSTNKQNEAITLQDAYEQFKDIDDELKNSDNLIKLVETLQEINNDE